MEEAVRKGRQRVDRGGSDGGRGCESVGILPVLNVKVRATVCVGAYTRVIDRVEHSLVRSFLDARTSPLLPGCLPTSPTPT